MRRSPTSHDVARLARVAQSTVSRALRDDPRVAEETRQRVRAAAAELAYVPSRRGRSLSTRATDQIGLVVRDLGNPFYMDAIRHLHRAIDRGGNRVVVITDDAGSPLTPELLLDGSLDGVVLATSLLGSTLAADLDERGLPVVLFNRALDTDALDTCVSDNAEGARIAALELLALGHSEIAAILGPPDTSTGRDRAAGLMSALAGAGIEVPPERVVTGPFSYEHGHGAFTTLMQGAVRPTAIFCANDVIALGALSAARATGVAIPGDVTVIGFDDIAMASWDVFALTTVRQDVPALAAAAARMLAARIADPGRPPERLVVPTELVRRRTHAPLSARGASARASGARRSL